MSPKLFYLLLSLFIFGLLGVYFLWPPHQPIAPAPSLVPLWQVRSIDTMKYSRDLARESLNDPNFDQIIDAQVASIAGTGASHVAIATPYDDEFVPILRRWVDAARRHGLLVWFRGNMSGWEKWFGYHAISRETHQEQIIHFIESNKDLFQSGDIFTPCPECENGGPGDPRTTGDVAGFRQFLIDENKAATTSFRNIGIGVTVGYPSMNYDVATLIMDKQTTDALGGIVAIDHYVNKPEDLNANITSLAELSGGKIFLGEFGAPIPDIHGDMSDAQQAAWLDQTLSLLSGNDHLIGVNYWVNVGGSTELWSQDSVPHTAVSVLTTYYNKQVRKIR